MVALQWWTWGHGLDPHWTTSWGLLWWGLLPFLLLALFGLKWALDFNRRSRQLLEILTLDQETVQLNRFNPDGSRQSWCCNRYWVSVHLHHQDGPVPNYVTLRGKGREVEIGAFLSCEERRRLFAELTQALQTVSCL